MVNAVSRLLQRRSLRRAVQQALESGVGVYHRAWRVAPACGEASAGELLGWCRQTLGEMHRPYGVDSVSLALAVLAEGGVPLASTNFAVLHPGDFYSGAFESDARETIRRWADDHFFDAADSRLSVVLFSWGDLTQALLVTA